MKRLVQGISALMAGAVALPALLSGLSPVFRTRARQWRVVGPLTAFPVGGVQEAAVEPPPELDWPAAPPQGVYVWRPDETTLVVFSRACTDLGCPVNYDPGSQCYFCPCHGGIFNTDGERLAGPPDRPLFRYDVRVRDGIVEVNPDSVPPAVG